MTPDEYVDDTLFALGPHHETYGLILGIAFRVLHEQIADAELPSGMKLLDLSDVREWLGQASAAATERSRKKAA